MGDMKQLEPVEALNQLKKLPFSKSWQNVYVNKTKKIFNLETKTLEETPLEEFIYIPAPSLVRHLSNDKEFLRFRSENKNSKEWDYKLVSDPVENNNRRMAIVWTENILQTLGIKFLIDDGYTMYILYEELLKLSSSDEHTVKEFINNLYIPKTLAHKKGITETFGD